LRLSYDSVMPHLPETKVASSQPNIQDAFLNFARRERLLVTIRMMDGQQIEGRIRNFDRFALIVEQGGTDHMLFKHAIASITSPRSAGNYFSQS
jgi:host factor-I protein